MPRPVLQISLFGSLRLAYAGSPHIFSAPPRTLPLFAHLLVHRAASTARDALAYTLWPDDAEETARTNLRRHIHYLQKALPAAEATAPWLVVTPKTVGWNIASPHTLDIADFERFSRDGARADAVELYLGDLLHGIDEEWLVYERERLRNIHAANLTALIETYRSQRELPDALLFAQRLLAHDPWREDAVRAVMWLRYEMGDRAGALAEYERFAQRLADDMGVEPMPETRANFSAISSAAVTSMQPAGATGGHTSSVDRWAVLPFSGREADKERLNETWERTRGGRGATVLIGGEAGIGKTRLVTSFTQDVEAQGGVVLRGMTSFPESAPYQAIATALNTAGAALNLARVEPVWLDALSEIVPRLRERPDATSAPALLDAQSEQRRLFEAFVRVLRALAEQHPIILVLEDLHWAGGATIALLETLNNRCAATNMLIIGTYREEEVLRNHPLRAYRRRLVRESPRSHLALSPLDRAAVTLLLERLWSDAAAPTAFADELYARSDGNPLFLSEILRDAVERGDLDHRCAHWSLPRAEDANVTVGIGAIILNRLERLSKHALAAAQLASVIGHAFDVELLRESAGWTEAQTLDALSELLDHHIVRDAGIATVDFTFSHHLITAAVYDNIAASDLPRRHRRVAQVMEQLYPDQRNELAAPLANHFARSGENEAAASYYVLAAERALALFAADIARTHVDRALAIGQDVSTRAAALLLCEEIDRRRGDRDAQARDLDELVTLSLNHPDDTIRLETLRRRIALAHVRGDAETERNAIEQLRENARTAGFADWEGVALQAEATRLLAGGHLDDARTNLEAALAAVGEQAEPAVRFAIFYTLADVAIHQADSDAAEDWLTRAEAVADACRDEFLCFRALYERYALARMRDRADDVYVLARSVLEQARLIGDAQAEMFAHLRLGNAALSEFEIAEAREHVERAHEMSAFSASPKERFGIITIKGMLAFMVGDIDQATSLFGEARTHSIEHADSYSQIVSAVNLACAACAGGDVPTALALTDKLDVLAHEMNIPYMEAAALGARGAALRRAGRATEARSALERSIALYRQIGKESSLGQDLSELTLLHIECDDLLAARAAAVELAQAAGAADWGSTNPHFMLWSAARAFRSLGEVERADALGEAAHALYLSRLEKIPDDYSRECFANMWFTREIIAAHERREWPRPEPLASAY